MRNRTIAALAVMFTLSAPASAGGILVFDTVNMLEQAKQWSQELKQWNQTVQHYESQMKSITGIRDIGSFTRQLSGLKGELEKVYQDGDAILGDFSSNPTGGLSAKAQQLFEQYGAFDMCKSGVDEKDNLCKARVVSTAVSVERGKDINKQLAASMDEISSLSGRIEQAADTKESQDLANALQAQSLKMQAIKAQYDVWVTKQQADEKLYAEQQQAQFRQSQKNAKVPTFD